MKLTATQIGARIGVTSYTIKRWYEFFNDLDAEEKRILHKQGMPMLPDYVVKNDRGDREWDEKAVKILEQFRDWVPPTKSGIFKERIGRR